MLVMRTIENSANPLGEFVSSQETLGLYHLPLAVYPCGLYSVQPRALLGQKAAYDPYSTAALCDLAVMSSQPASELPGDVPGVSGFGAKRKRPWSADPLAETCAPLPTTNVRTWEVSWGPL